MSSTSELNAMQRTYKRWAGIYDAVYEKLLRPGQLHAIGEGLQCGRRILEVGVGTGLSLGLYPREAEVTGIDISPDMLERAREKVARNGLSQVKDLKVMDAGALDFESGSFDAALALYVITLVPDPERALGEMARVVRPGGKVIVASHFGAEDGPIAALESAVAPVVDRIGWSSDFKLSRLSNWSKRSGLLEFGGVVPMVPAGFFKVAVFTRTAVPVQDAQLQAAE